MFSGALSDRPGKRKLLAVIGYGLGAATKPVFPLEEGVGGVFADRVGKGIRGAPRDALVADSAPAELRGTAFGIFNVAVGVALLLASVIAGALWGRYGATATFLAGAVFALLAMAGLLLARTGRG